MKDYMNMTSGERRYATSLDEQGKLWFFHPKRFPLPEPYGSYTPDFYVVEDGMFVEVTSTRQAYSYNRNRYIAFRAMYPHLKLEVVNVGAWKNGEAEKRVAEPRRAYNRLTTCKFSTKRLMTNELNRIRATQGMSIIDLAQRIGKPYGTVYATLRGVCASPKTVSRICEGLGVPIEQVWR